MPNYVKCRITAPKQIIDALAGKVPVDFEKILPMPEGISIECCSVTTEAAERALVERPVTGVDFIDALHEHNVSRCPSPLTFNDKQWSDFIQVLQNRRHHGAYTWYDWSVKNWGTKWNAYRAKRCSETVVEFETAWSAPRPVLEALSKAHPTNEIVLEYADEDYGSNLGIVAYVNGTPTERQIADVHAHIESLWPGYDKGDGGEAAAIT